MQNTQIKCPNCGTSIDVEDIMSHQLEEGIKQKYQTQLENEKKKYESEYQNLNKAKEQFEQKKKQENELFNERLEKQLKEDRIAIETKLKQKLNEEQSEQFKAFQKELDEKSEQIKELNRTKAEIEKLKREKSELKEVAETEALKKLNETLLIEKEKIKKSEEEKFGNQVKEFQKQLEEKEKYQAQLENEKKKYESEFQNLNKAKEQFEQKKKQENELFNERIEKQLKEERIAIETKLKHKLNEEQSEQFKAFQKELDEKSEQIKELNRTKAEIEKLKREKAEIKDVAEAEAQKKINELLISEKEKIKKSEEERHELRFKEMQKQLDDQKNLTEEMKRKQEQGSMQLQGEVQELAIEEWLTLQFPLDSIEEIKKGARGGDCIQTVNTRSRQNCGTIYYESKRTKDFQASWIEKFKTDIREKSANIGVLVTEVMPSEMDRMGLKDGIWICNYEEFKGLCAVLRESIIQISMTVSSQENKGDKMHMLYDYLTSNTFRMQVEAIVEGFTQMKIALDSEKRAMQRIWKEREKQIEKVITNTIDMHGSIKGIAGNAIQAVKALELSEFEEPVNDEDQ